MSIGEKTRKDLTDAFAGESQANRKYLAFAKKAEAEGYYQAARLFRAAAESETIHAHRHLDFIGGVGDTTANLGAAVEGETYEYTEMYPAFMADAAAAGDDNVAQYIKFVTKVEEEHAFLYKDIMDSLGNVEETSYYVCSYCGHVHVGGAPEKCPVCGAPKSAFKEIM
jgi:rubrerythrin